MNQKISAPNQILLKKTAYMNLLRTVIESASREPMGFLFGFKRKNKGTFVNAYPVITADRQPTSVSYGNDNAIKRIRGLHNLMNLVGGTEGNWVGGYHSHPIIKTDKLRELDKLSSEDLDFIGDEITAHNQDYWVEILIRFNEKKYKTKQKLGKKVKMYKNRMKIILTDSKYHKYHLLLSAYLIRKKSDKKIEGKKYKGKNKTDLIKKDYIVKELKVRKSTN